MRSLANIPKINLCWTILILFLPFESLMAADRCEPTHLDGPWQGEDVTGPLERLRAAIQNDSESISIENAIAMLDEPEHILKIKNRARANWVLEVSRNFEEIGCGSNAMETQWAFLIIEMEFSFLEMKSCSIYKKTAFVKDSRRPDPFSSTSPLDSEYSCDSYLSAK